MEWMAPLYPFGCSNSPPRMLHQSIDRSFDCDLRSVPSMLISGHSCCPINRTVGRQCFYYKYCNSPSMRTQLAINKVKPWTRRLTGNSIDSFGCHHDKRMRCLLIWSGHASVDFKFRTIIRSFIAFFCDHELFNPRRVVAKKNSGNSTTAAGFGQQYNSG